MANPAPRRERILVIDDDTGLAEVVQLLLAREGYGVERAGTVKRGVERAGSLELDLVITDLKLPDGTGLDAIRAIRGMRREVPIIMMTSYSSMESAIAALRAGAVDYIVKPFDNDELLHAIERALNERRISHENAVLKRNLRSAFRGRTIIGESPGMKRIADLLRKVAASDANVLIFGEAGTGKEFLALSLHYASPRADGPFVPVKCGGYPRERLEAELFGHASGALASSLERPDGLIREAQGGTLFLDEVSELSPSLQVKLLRVLQEKAVRPLGGRHAHEIDVRFVAATHRDLEAEIARGQFRRDLFYRMNVIPMQVPPLRERGGDVLLLARHFLEHHARRLGKPLRGFDAEFSSFLEGYAWPGNVRELENLIERAVILSQGPLLTARDLAEVAPALPMVRASPSRSARPLAIEEYIRDVVERFQDVYSETELARMLGMGRKALWMRRRQWGLKRSRKLQH